MRPTAGAQLLGLAAAAGAVSLLLSRLADSLLRLPLPAVIVIAVIALVEVPLARSVRARLAGRPRTRPILPSTVARVAALAQASSLTGALTAGAWLGLLADRVPRLGAADAARTDAIVAGAGVATAVLLVVAALRLEGVCRVPDPPGGGRR